MVINSRMSNWTKILNKMIELTSEKHIGIDEEYEIPHDCYGYRQCGVFKFVRREKDYYVWVHSTSLVNKPRYVCVNNLWYKLSVEGKCEISVTFWNRIGTRMTHIVKLSPVKGKDVLLELGVNNIKTSPDGMCTVRL